MKSLESCLSVENGIRFSRSEKGKTFELHSAQTVQCDIYNVDKCLFQDEHMRRCDWLFVIPKNRDRNQHLDIPKQLAYYIELKGEDHKNVCEQLYNAIDKTKAAFPNFEFHARIVSTKGLQPELRTNGYYKKIKRLIRREIIVVKVHKGNQYKHTETI